MDESEILSRNTNLLSTFTIMSPNYSPSTFSRVSDGVRSTHDVRVVSKVRTKLEIQVFLNSLLHTRTKKDSGYEERQWISEL